MQKTQEIKNETVSGNQSVGNEANQLLEHANQCAISALENLARIQGDAFEKATVRDLFPLFKVYVLFSNLEEFERDILIHLYQAKNDIKQLARQNVDGRSGELAEVETRFFTLRDRVQSYGIPDKLTAAQRTVLETEFFRSRTQSLSA